MAPSGWGEQQHGTMVDLFAKLSFGQSKPLRQLLRALNNDLIYMRAERYSPRHNRL